MPNLIELSFDSQELLPVRFDLLNLSYPAWNHFIIDQNNDRFMYIRSLIQSNLINKEKPHLIKGIVWTENSEIIKLANNCSANIIKTSDLKINLLKQLPIIHDSSFFNPTVKKEIREFSQRHAIDEIASGNPYDIKKFIQSENFKIFNDEIQTQLVDFLNNHYRTNTQKINLISFLQNVLDLPDSCVVRDLIDFASSFLLKNQMLSFNSIISAANQMNELEIVKKLEQFKQTNDFDRFFNINDTWDSSSTFLVVNSSDKFINTIILSFLIDSDMVLETTKDVIRFFFFDSFLHHIKKEDELEIITWTLRSARKRGISTILSERFLPKVNNRQIHPILSCFQTYCFGAVGTQAIEIIDEFRIEDRISIQSLKHDYGISYIKPEEKEYSSLYLPTVTSYSSFTNKRISYGQALLLQRDVTKIKKIKNRFIDYIVNNEIGIFALETELLPTDLGYIDTEMKRHNIKRLILLLKSNEIDEQTLYNNYGYKKCKNTIIIKTAQEFYQETYDKTNEMRDSLQTIFKKEKKYDGKLLILTDDLKLL